MSPAAATWNVVRDFPRDLYPVLKSASEIALDHTHEGFSPEHFMRDLAHVTRPTAEDRDDMEAARAARADAREHGTIPWEQIRDELES